MKYIFKINIYTDGDFYLPYVPVGMKFDGDYRYEFKKEYNDIDKAIKDILKICTFIKKETYSSRNYVREAWFECIDEFMTRVKAVNNTQHNLFIEERMYGNYEGTEISFYTEDDYVNCGFFVTDEEYKLIKDNHNDITKEMIKEAVLGLFRSK